MKTFARGSILLFLVCGVIHAAPGDRLPSERSAFTDELTGLTITRLTTSPAKDDKIYQTHPNWTADGAYLIFNSHRTGASEVFALDEATGEIVQISDGDGGAFILGHNRNVMFIVRSGVVIELDLNALLRDSKSRVMNAAESYRRELGRLPEGASLSGTFTEDADGKSLYFGLALPDGRHAIERMNIATGECSQIISPDFKVGHAQAHPTRPGVISYCYETGGDAPQRMWIVNADGTGNRPFYAETYDEWVTHETWWTDDRMLFTIWPKDDAMKQKPHGIASVSLKDFSHTIHDQFPYWHVCGTSDGKFAIGDTFDGRLIMIRIATGERRLLTQGHRPKGMTSHQHQSLDPSGRRLLFVSSKFGNWDLMSVEIPAWASLKPWTDDAP